MPNDTNTPAGRRLDATCPACAGAVTDAALRDAVRLFEVCAGPEPRDVAAGITAVLSAEWHRLTDRAALASARPPVLEAVRTHDGFCANAGGQHCRHDGVCCYCGDAASARPADDGLTAAYLYGVEHGRDARARPDSQPAPTNSQVGSSASARTPGAEALRTAWLDGVAARWWTNYAGSTDEAPDWAATSATGHGRREWEAAADRYVSRALAAPAPAPAPHSIGCMWHAGEACDMGCRYENDATSAPALSAAEQRGYDRGYQKAYDGIRRPGGVFSDMDAALRSLVFAARTSGGVAGRDDGLVAACECGEAIIARVDRLTADPDTAPAPAPVGEDAIRTAWLDGLMARTWTNHPESAAEAPRFYDRARRSGLRFREAEWEAAADAYMAQRAAGAPARGAEGAG